MLKTELTELLGIKHPIIQAGMGPFSNNKLCIAAANAGVLGLVSTSGLNVDKTKPKIFKHFAESGGASWLTPTSQTAMPRPIRPPGRIQTPRSPRQWTNSGLSGAAWDMAREATESGGVYRSLLPVDLAFQRPIRMIMSN